MKNFRITALSAAMMLALSAAAAAQSPIGSTQAPEQPVAQPTDASMQHAPIPATDATTDTIENTGTAPTSTTASTTSDDATTDSSTTDTTASAEDSSATDSTTLNDVDEAASASTDLPEKTDAAVASGNDDASTTPVAGDAELAVEGDAPDSAFSSGDKDGDKLLSRDEVSADSELTANFDAIDKDDNDLIAYGEWEDRAQLMAQATAATPISTTDTTAPATTAESSSDVAASATAEGASSDAAIATESDATTDTPATASTDDDATTPDIDAEEAPDADEAKDSDD